MEEIKKSISEIPTAYDSSKELEIYELWEKSGYFKPEKVNEYFEKNKIKKVGHFGIPLPPPNANGDLHLGHTCGYAFQDLMGRYNRMSGKTVLLLPGKDHAGIQTESVFSKLLEKEGKSKWEMGREEFYNACYDFCMVQMQNALKQEKRIGLSADWSRQFFTLDPRLTEVIYSTFFKLFSDGLVYRGKRITNICPSCKTALADIDTSHVEMRGIFAYIVYPFKDEQDNEKAFKLWGQKGIVVATTRPETMLGDSAVAVNPDDKRYKEFVGHVVVLPIADREIPIITDENVDIENGTGALKVTPAHSPIDWEIGKKNGLEVINVINSDAKMEGNIPERFKGMGTVECSKAIVKELDGLKLLVKIENIKHDVAVCERCGTPIEPIVSNQWYVSMKSLAKDAAKSIRKGEIRIIPEGQQRDLLFFLDNLEDWCVSRQLWWGHRIPIWYSGGKDLYDWLNENPGKTVQDYSKENKKEVTGSGKVFLGDKQPESDPDFPDAKFEEESDVFDTWFSSGQWPFSTLKANGNDFELYYPTNVMETARDILRWWVARMIMLGLYITGKAPFNTVFLHGMILAEDGTKMSKSKGNTTKPTEIFEKYGADALRIWYYNESLPGSNSPMREEKIKGNRFFINKIWNASRFLLSNIQGAELQNIISTLNTNWSSWENGVPKTGRFEETESHIKKMRKYYDTYKFNLAAETAREFFWHTYCDKWIEEIKEEIKPLNFGDSGRVQKLAEMVYILKENLKIMHPMMPFVTEAIWQELVKLELAQGLIIIQQI